jgi:nucleotide-binding universal stress UspA family protein
MIPDSMELSAGKPILACVAFCSESERALVTGARLAESSGARLVILHVVHEPANRPGYYHREGRDDTLLPIAVIAERMLREFLSEVRVRHPGCVAALDGAEIRVVPGLPETRIPEVAQRIGAQLVLMGSNGRGSLARLLGGSISDRVAHKVSIPVTVVHAGSDAWDMSAAPSPERAAGTLATR